MLGVCVRVCVRDKERGVGWGAWSSVRSVLRVPGGSPPLWSELQFNRQPEICFGQMLQMFRQPGLWSSGVTQEGKGVQRLYAQRFNKAAWGWIYSHLYSLPGPPDAYFRVAGLRRTLRKASQLADCVHSVSVTKLVGTKKCHVHWSDVVDCRKEGEIDFFFSLRLLKVFLLTVKKAVEHILTVNRCFCGLKEF